MRVRRRHDCRAGCDLSRCSAASLVIRRGWLRASKAREVARGLRGADPSLRHATTRRLGCRVWCRSVGHSSRRVHGLASAGHRARGIAVLDGQAESLGLNSRSRLRHPGDGLVEQSDGLARAYGSQPVERSHRSAGRYDPGRAPAHATFRHNAARQRRCARTGAARGLQGCGRGYTHAVRRRLYGDPRPRVGGRRPLVLRPGDG
jgi:hypothetical protein